MQLLISDANIFIDLEEGNLLDKLFLLPYTFKTPDILYAEELEAEHSHLMAMGLTLTEVNEQSLSYAMGLISQHKATSTNDCFALVCAKQEACPLLTGDDALRKLAHQEGVVVMGTVWIIEQMVHQAIIDKATAETAYIKMKQAGRRLPWKHALQRLSEM